MRQRINFNETQLSETFQDERASVLGIKDKGIMSHLSFHSPNIKATLTRKTKTKCPFPFLLLIISRIIFSPVIDSLQLRLRSYKYKTV